MSQCNWREEHGEEYAVPDAIASHPMFKDVSWHNDMCPVFNVVFAGASVALWVEHPDPLQRENRGDENRFCVSRYEVEKNEPDQWFDHVRDEYNGNDVQLAIRTALTVALEQAQAHPILSRALTPALLENVRKAMA